MAKVDVPRTAYAEETMRVLRGCGCLLVSGNMDKSNVMTIGWGLIGPLWSRPFFVVAVRPSRHTYKFIEKTGDFTVNVPIMGMEEIADYCGSVSGRDYNKFKEKNLTLKSGRNVRSPVILECGIHYECRVSFKTKVSPTAIPQDIINASYSSGDYHTLYFGEILSSYADRNIRNLL